MHFRWVPRKTRDRGYLRQFWDFGPENFTTARNKQALVDFLFSPIFPPKLKTLEHFETFENALSVGPEGFLWL